MTNEELLALIRQLVADARAESVAIAKLAAVNVAGALAAADQATAGAQAGVAGARTVSNTEQARDSTLVNQLDSLTGLIQKQVDSDVDTPEAWKANIKRTYDVHQTYDMETALRNRAHFDNAVLAYQTHVGNLNHYTLQALANNQNQSNLANLQGVAHRDIAIDREWNINETDLAAKSAAVLTDAALSKAVKTIAA